jgi:hypothetical protein
MTCLHAAGHCAHEAHGAHGKGDDRRSAERDLPSGGCVSTVCMPGTATTIRSHKQVVVNPPYLNHLKSRALMSVDGLWTLSML